MAKQLVFTTEAQQALKRGVDILASAVATTLGPKGRNVALDKKLLILKESDILAIVEK